MKYVRLGLRTFEESEYERNREILEPRRGCWPKLSFKAWGKVERLREQRSTAELAANAAITESLTPLTDVGVTRHR